MYVPWVVIVNLQSEIRGRVRAPEGDTSFLWVVKCLGQGYKTEVCRAAWDKPAQLLEPEQKLVISASDWIRRKLSWS